MENGKLILADWLKYLCAFISSDQSWRPRRWNALARHPGKSRHVQRQVRRVRQQLLHSVWCSGHCRLGLSQATIIQEINHRWRKVELHFCRVRNHSFVFLFVAYDSLALTIFIASFYFCLYLSILAVTFCLMDRIDTTLSPGPKRPYNFFGSLTTYQFSEVHELLKTTGTEPSDGLVVFGHYPLSTVVSPSPGIKEVRFGLNVWKPKMVHHNGYLCEATFDLSFCKGFPANNTNGLRKFFSQHYL